MFKRCLASSLGKGAFLFLEIRSLASFLAWDLGGLREISIPSRFLTRMSVAGKFSALEGSLLEGACVTGNDEKSGSMASCLTGVEAVSNSVLVEINNSGELWEVSDSRRLMACVTGGGVEMTMLTSSSEGLGSSTSEGSGYKGPTGMHSGTVSKVGLKGVFLF